HPVFSPHVLLEDIVLMRRCTEDGQIDIYQNRLVMALCNRPMLGGHDKLMDSRNFNLACLVVCHEAGNPVGALPLIVGGKRLIDRIMEPQCQLYLSIMIKLMGQAVEMPQASADMFKTMVVATVIRVLHDEGI